MFQGLLYALRAQGVPVGVEEWLTFLRAATQGIAGDVDELYTVGRAVLCRTEADFDAWDIAFASTFRNVELPPGVEEALRAWLASARPGEGEQVDPGLTPEELWEQFLDRLRTQKERHDGGSHWIGTGGTSPFGNAGRASSGVRVGGSGGGRSAIRVAMDRRWENYRTDRTLDIRDLKVALSALRKLTREGRYELDLPGTIDRTCENAGEIELVERRERQNQVRLVLLMDAGGSMAPHAERVSQLFSAADQLHIFKSFKAYYFHNCVYQWLWTDYEKGERSPTADVLEGLTAGHRLIFVGDASMAPYELFSDFAWGGHGRRAGVDWLRILRQRCPASVWLNPDPRRWWVHPTVDSIGRIFPMFELSVDGLREAVRHLRAPV